MTIFCDELLETKGFENHAMVTSLGIANRSILTGRIPAIAKKRSGPLDAVLRRFPKKLKELDETGENFDFSSFSIIDFSILGTFNDISKRSTSFQLMSQFENLKNNVIGDVDGKVLVNAMEYEFAPRQYHRPGSLNLTEEEENASDAYDTLIKLHPIGTLLHCLIGAANDVDGIRFIGQDNHIEPTTWYFVYGVTGPDDGKYFAIHLNREELEEELEEILGKYLETFKEASAEAASV